MNRDQVFAVATAPKRASLHWQAGAVTWGEICDQLERPADKKEAGNTVYGTLRETTVVCQRDRPPHTGLHRRKDAVVSRSLLALDVDTPPRGFLADFTVLWPYAAAWHTTWSSSPDQNKFRLLLPLSREVAPDEYIVLARVVMSRLGSEAFDPSTDQPERYMFQPSAQHREWYQHGVIDGEPLPVDQLLAEWDPDLSQQPLPPAARKKRNPFELEGVVGAFNRAYEDWDLLIEEYGLPYVRVSDDRYQLVGAVSQAGMGPIRDAEGLVYSHHVNDPAYGQTCTAFDLVRLHRFGHLDEDAKSGTPINKLPSQTAMQDLASEDHRVTAQLVGVDFDAEWDNNQWRLKLQLSKRTKKFEDDVRNWDLLRQHDPVFRLLRYNELALSPEWTDDVPWRAVTDATRTVTTNDRWEFIFHIERTYGYRPTFALGSSLIDSQAWKAVYNPVRDYLNGLVWDGTPRVETCLPGVRPTPYTRLVARKVMVAAVARMEEPGCKWDHMLVLFGEEGLGKTWWIERVARGYAATLGRIDNKDTLLIMQRSWFLIADESHSLRKADFDAQKEFLTRRSDVFRMPYDRETLVHQRHSVIVSTTNDEVFLRRQEGNRRFLVVHCVDPVDFDAMTTEYVDQLWAEAVYLYRAGESLFLDPEESELSAQARDRFLEEDALTGVIVEYLDALYPEDWEERSLLARQQWLDGRASGFEPEGTAQLQRVCSTQIWAECLGQKKGDARRMDLLDISNVLRKLPGWVAMEGRSRLPGYGPQLVFMRTDLL